MNFFKRVKSEQKPEDIQCPVCGYYCLGHGGYGCIIKPHLCGYVEDEHGHWITKEESNERRLRILLDKWRPK